MIRSTTLFEVFFEFIIYSTIIFKSITDTDNNFWVLSMIGLKRIDNFEQQYLFDYSSF